ncbi:hypothetical protein BC834DRAFT_38594 [Gloeopeniophorella convolvens]|nr:hypothetical protein BC834DRAFT_38594 [Gloeopeniophorella convolvens]
MLCAHMCSRSLEAESVPWIPRVMKVARARERTCMGTLQLPRMPTFLLYVFLSTKYLWPGRYEASSASHHSETVVPYEGIPGAGGLDRTKVFALFQDPGLAPFVFTGSEAARAHEAPAILWNSFTKTFGGHWGAEWPLCDKVEGYTNLISVGPTAQPYSPAAPGEAGVLLCPPTVGPYGSRPQYESLHAFISTCGRVRGGSLRYHGKYATVSLPQEKAEAKWSDIPGPARDMWLKRVHTLTTRSMCALRTRIRLRQGLQREPTLSEIERSLREDPSASITWKGVSAAFKRGDEKMSFIGIQCIGYDSGLATFIEQRVAPTTVSKFDEYRPI